MMHACACQPRVETTSVITISASLTCWITRRPKLYSCTIDIEAELEYSYVIKAEACAEFERH